MRFDQQDGNSHELTFFGPPFSYKDYHILRNTPSLYRLLHPPYDIEPRSNDLAGIIYPFFYQDAKRTYFAMPTLDKQRPARHVVENLAIEIDIGAIDSLLSKIKYIEKGDPAPNESQMNSITMGDALSQALSANKKGEFGLLFSNNGPSGQVVVQNKPATTISVQALLTYLKFHIFFHPHVCEFIKNLNRKGIPGLLTLNNQQLDNDYSHLFMVVGQKPTIFERNYDPNADLVHWDYPKENVDFRPEGAYSVYNWELFFHAPLMIADRLSKDQRFQDAQDWFHFIFNPTVSSDFPSPRRYWNTLPFFNNSHPERQQIVTLLAALKSKDADKQTREMVEKQIAEWRDNPFNPHLIARMRITAYQKTVVMKYIDNLIAWGDQLFRRDTIESINEATQLYIMAYNILGSRPEEIPSRGKIEVKTYKQLQPDLDKFSNALVTLENEFPFSSEIVHSSTNGGNGASSGLGVGITFYFCIPKNEKLLGYWDTVADRLFKIRHCMNIEGVVRQLPLFEPPIDPALLVKATAMGLDINSVLNDINSPLPLYRFNHLVQKALELCSELKSLGAALLTALEKKDAEELVMLRANHELSLLKEAREIRVQQFLEAKANITALERTKDVVQARKLFYEQTLAAGLNLYEKAHLDKLKAANDKQAEALTYELIAQGVSQIPNATVGTSGYSSAVMTAQFGGSNLSAANSAYARFLTGQASDETYEATKASIAGVHKRRDDDWTLQLTLANREITQIDKQITAAEIRAAVAQKELQHHDRQIENSAAVEEFLRNKYTNQELYGWMLSQISAVFFQSYKLAYDMAKRAEKAYRFERGLTDSNFVQFGYWDSLRKGLLSGERLYLDLKRLEMAYLDQNKREYEISKHVSLVLHDPLALITLKETGGCEVELTESLFDADYPGHYMRRLKSVSLTIPCVVGPYTSINCTLTLLSNKTRIKSTATEPYAENVGEDDNRFVTNFAALQSIATSHAQNDSGMFELNFRDERYLPFEGAGAISRWRIELPKDCNAFDFNTLSDVVLHLKYTAREGGERLKEAAKGAMKKVMKDDGEGNAPLARMFSAKHEFPTEWYRFLHPTGTAAPTLRLELIRERFQFQFRGKGITISEVKLFLNPKEGFDYDKGQPLTINLGQYVLKDKDVIESLASGLEFKSAGSPVEKLPFCSLPNVEIKPPKGLALTTTHANLESLQDVIEDIWIVCEYSVTASDS